MTRYRLFIAAPLEPWQSAPSWREYHPGRLFGSPELAARYAREDHPDWLVKIEPSDPRPPNRLPSAP